MRFGHPSILYLLTLLPAVVLFLVWARRRKKREIALFAGKVFDLLLTRGISPWRTVAKEILLVLSLLLLVIAWARPQWGERWEETKRRGLDIFVAIDLSKSMLAGDVSPSRIERARRKLTDLIPLLEGDRIGLIGFAGEAFVLMPLTLDYNALPLYVESLSPDLLTVPGTALSSAVNLAVQSFEKEGPAESHAILLMSDGEDLSGEVAPAIDTALSKGIQIDTLGIGTTDGAPIPEAGGGFKKDKSGQLILTRLEEASLEKMAQETDGIYVRSVAGDDDLKLIYERIRGGREEKELKGGKERRFMERYQWFLGFAILLLILESILREAKREKGPAMLVSMLLLGILILPRPALAFGIIGTIREGEQLYKAGRYEEALQKFLDAQKKHPDDPRLQYNLGNTYHQLKKYEEAGKIFSKGAEGTKSNSTFQERNIYNQGNNQYRQGALEDAIRSYEEALKLDPKDEDARYNLEFVKKQLEQQKQQEQQKQHDQKDQQDQQKERQEDQNQQNDQKDQKEGTAQQETQNGKMGQEEAKRWLSGLKEGRPKVYSGGDKKESGKKNVEKDW